MRYEVRAVLVRRGLHQLLAKCAYSYPLQLFDLLSRTYDLASSLPDFSMTSHPGCPLEADRPAPGPTLFISLGPRIIRECMGTWFPCDWKHALSLLFRSIVHVQAF